MLDLAQGILIEFTERSDYGVSTSIPAGFGVAGYTRDHEKSSGERWLRANGHAAFTDYGDRLRRAATFSTGKSPAARKSSDRYAKSEKGRATAAARLLRIKARGAA